MALGRTRAHREVCFSRGTLDKLGESPTNSAGVKSDMASRCVVFGRQQFLGQRPTPRPGVAGSGPYLTYSVLVKVSGLETVTLLNRTVERRGQYTGYINARQIWCGKRGNRQHKMQISDK